MQTREIILRILRMNLIPAPRVIAPGPATRFPLAYVDASGEERVVSSLAEARAISRSVAGSSGDRRGEDFFVEILPVKRLIQFKVSGFFARADHLSGDAAMVSDCAGDDAAADMAVRAAYCLGLDESEVTVAFGPGGPWVLRAGPAALLTRRKENLLGRRIEFLGARAEYLAVDLRTGLPVHEFFSLDVTTEGEPARLFAAAPETGCKLVSSPLPYPEMPLSTRLLFRGEPVPGFLRALDRSASLLGMLVSPADEARERNATEEGLLGAYRSAGDGVFEYVSVPSLLWNPQALAAVCGLAKDAVSGLSQAESRAAVKEDLRSWEAGLEDLYRFQRGYYNADKAYAPAPNGISSGFGFRDDFRAAWGIRVPETSETWATVGSFAGSEYRAPEAVGLEVSAGACSAFVAPDRLLAPDVLNGDGFLSVSPAWALSAPIVPGPGLAADLGLSEGVLYRASEGGRTRRTRQVADAASIRLRIGPIIGIMAPPYVGTGRFGVETDRFKHMILLGADMGLLVYVFFPDGADWDAKLVNAWTYRNRRGWIQGRFPVPDVVYDRHIPEILPSGGIQDVAREFLLRQPQVLFVNSLPFVGACRDKLRAHGILASTPELRPCLPDTCEAAKPSQVARFIEARERTFLKLRSGTGSKGIYLFENLGFGYRVSKRDKGLPPEARVMSGRTELEDAVAGIMGESPRSYIVQEGIDLIPLPNNAGGTFEVRVICQKGGAGLWLRTGMVCRVSPSADGFMVPREEVHFRVDDVLPSLFSGKAGQVKESIRRLARVIPPVLEEAAGRGGELSVDLGIDRQGNPWLIEVNSKPATLFRDIGAFRLRELSLRRVLNYAVAMFDDGVREEASL